MGQLKNRLHKVKWIAQVYNFSEILVHSYLCYVVINKTDLNFLSLLGIVYLVAEIVMNTYLFLFLLLHRQEEDKMERNPEDLISWSQYRRLRVQLGDDWWINTSAAPNGIGPVCLYCDRLIDSEYTDHTVECPVRRYIGWEDYELDGT